MNPIEVLAAILLLINVALVARRSLWNYPFALVAVTLYAVIFYQQKLYSDMILQGFFFLINLYGWYGWAQARSDRQVPVGWMTARARWIWGVATLVVWATWSVAMARFTDVSAPFVDGAVAIVSVSAQWLLARRRVENWWLWIVVNSIAVPLFASRGLYLTACVYAVLLGIAIAGLLEWRRAARKFTGA